ncbi:SMP-30/gluconolactonase/LRE family protein [Formosa sp. S-31]|uniref:SMP-30/gluconolactonase/LRE family protein n=1 Tax=Formosa sp. S-31 TaxID=2790949 RepID=UPI003EB96855
MKTLITVLFLVTCLKSQSQNPKIEEVCQFKGQQVTGVTVSQNGRIFTNFPRWRETVENSVVEVDNNGTPTPYPNKTWNNWEVDKPVSDSIFVAVQSVVADANKLYVLDTRNSLWKGVIDTPRIFVFNLSNNTLEDILLLSKDSYKPNSYTNDLRIDHKNKVIFITDSNDGAIIVYNLNTRSSKRVLDNHYSTEAETNHLNFKGNKWGGHPVHSDGIALNIDNNRLFYHSLTGYTLYSAPTNILTNGSEKEIEASVKKEAKTGAPDGMIFDSHGNLYLADLEHSKIDYLTPEGKLKTLAQGEDIKWADTFSIHKGYLYFTNSRINEIKGDISNMTFTINRIKID